MPRFTIKNISATFVIVAFFVVANAILIHTVTTPFVVLAYGIPMVVGVASAVGFFYVFTHEETFPFAHAIEVQQEKIEKRWLKFLPPAGKVATVLMLGIVGGPILAAFSAQIFIPHLKEKYKILAVIGLISGFLISAAARGFFGRILLPLLHFLGK